MLQLDKQCAAACTVVDVHDQYCTVVEVHDQSCSSPSRHQTQVWWHILVFDWFQTHHGQTLHSLVAWCVVQQAQTHALRLKTMLKIQSRLGVYLRSSVVALPAVLQGHSASAVQSLREPLCQAAGAQCAPMLCFLKLPLLLYRVCCK